MTRCRRPPKIAGFISIHCQLTSFRFWYFSKNFLSAVCVTCFTAIQNTWQQCFVFRIKYAAANMFYCQIWGSLRGVAEEGIRLYVVSPAR